MITGLRTNNFRKLTALNIKFTAGTNLIFGENGEGKTTTYEAIRFALYGTRATSGTAESLVTWGKGGMWVELDINGHTIRRTTANCKITNIEEGETVASGNSPCTKFIEDMLGCSLKDFDLLYMSKQGETSGLITFGGAELNRKVEEFAGVDLVDKVIKKLGSGIHGLSTAAESFEMLPVDNLKNELTEITAMGLQAAAVIANATESKTRYKADLDHCIEKLRGVEIFNAKQQQLTDMWTKYNLAAAKSLAERAGFEVQLDNLRAELGEIGEPDEGELASAKALYLRISKAIVAFNRLPNPAQMETDLAVAKENVTAYSVYCVSESLLQEALVSLTATYDVTMDDVREAKRELLSAKSKADAGVCSQCHRPLEDHSPEQAAAELSLCESKLIKCNATADAARVILDERKAGLAAHRKTNPGSQWSAACAMLEAKIIETSEQREILEVSLKEGDLDSVRKRVDSLEQSHENYFKVSRAEAKIAASLEITLENVPKEPEEQPLPVLSTTEGSHHVALATENYTTACDEVSTATHEHATITTNFKLVRAKIVNAELNNSKAAEIAERLNTHKQLYKHLSDARIEFMRGVWTSIMYTATHFVNKSTGGWISAVGRNDRGDFTFTENGIEAIAKESASGAQKAFIGTAIKVGLAQAKMGSSAMVLLDEPTADMRDERASQLAAGLMMLTGQKIMITHRDSERMIAQNIIKIGD
jgi:DNA repair ATPase RecN